MKIFEDVFSGDEVLSDALDIRVEHNSSIIAVTSKFIVPDDGSNIDVGNANHFGGGGDEEGGQSGGNPEVVKVNNILENFQLEEFMGTKKDIMASFKEKIAKAKKRLEGREDRLKEWGPDGAVSKFVKECFAKFDDCKFYMGKNYDGSEETESMFIISFWVKDDDTGETFHYFKDCLREVKV